MIPQGLSANQSASTGHSGVNRLRMSGVLTCVHLEPRGGSGSGVESLETQKLDLTRSCKGTGVIRGLSKTIPTTRGAWHRIAARGL